MQKGEIHVGDANITYDVPLYNNDVESVNFDPSDADTLTLLFKMPGVANTISRTATAVQRTINGESIWCLSYTVVEADLTEFHTTSGPMKIQGLLEYADGSSWHTDKISKDFQGRELRVSENL